MSEITLDAAKSAKEEAQQGNLRENDAGIPEELGIDYDEHSPQSVTLHPEVLVVGDHIARIDIQTYGNDGNLLQMEQNLEGGVNNQGKAYGYDLGLTIADPEVVEGQVWVPEDDEDNEYSEWKVIGDPESDANCYELRESVVREDGEVVGSEIDGIGDLPGGNSWDGQPRDEKLEGVDYIEVSVNASRAAEILGALDTAGFWCENQDGELVEGLFEAPPQMGTDEYDNEKHGNLRLTGYPELRADVVGEQIALMCEFDADGEEIDTRTAIDTTVFTVNGGALDALVPLTPEDDAYAKPEYPRGNNRYWTETEGSAPTPDDVGADAEPNTDAGLSDAQAEMSEETTYDDLTEDGQQFVDQAVENVMAQGDFETITDLEDYDERVQTQKAKHDIRADGAELAAIIDERSSS